MDKEKLKEKIQDVRNRCANLKLEDKKVLFYSAVAFVSGFVFGYLVKRHRR